MQLKDTALFRQQAYIDGAWLDADSGQTISVNNPATGEVLAKVQCASQADVDRAVAAVEAARQADPELVVDGPLQFDAACDPGVGKKKAPDSAVAGRANVFIFPDLEAGNAGYKIAQRTGDALAVGPILQGLNKPVNDLSRGALVEDIVNTIAITAVQAQAVAADVAHVAAPDDVDDAAQLVQFGQRRDATLLVAEPCADAVDEALHGPPPFITGEGC